MIGGKTVTYTLLEEPRRKRIKHPRSTAIVALALVAIIFYAFLELESAPLYYAPPHPQSTPVAIGIADYGIGTMNNGKEVLYSVNASQVTATSTLYSMSFPSVVSSVTTEASLQLNVNLVVKTAGSTYVYWLQNVEGFWETPTSTSASLLAVVDNVWNVTARGSNVTETGISGVGSVSYSKSRDVTFYSAWAVLYGANGQFLYFTFPLQLVSSIDLTIPRNLGNLTVKVGFNVSINGTLRSYPDNQNEAPVIGLTYDNVTITEPQPVTDAYIYVDYRSLRSGGFGYYDAEYVFGGPGNGSSASFSGMDCTMSLSYMVGGQMVQPQAVYEFGLDTAEGTTNLSTSYAGNNQFIVTTGIANLTKCYYLD